MPGARPSPRRPAVGDHFSRQAVSAADAAFPGPRSHRSGPGPAAGAWSRARASRPLLRRAVGLIVGMAVLIPAATALDGSRSPHVSHPTRPPSVAAGVAQH
ncbi:conserved hypothetical protein [Frankia canadensis]|uniref:Uncharacterized protein n=1 Tax=Frankia canadensis TaxID=1836972 RepID=A0A2I2KLY2_9ACTN|nr:hypothetical protein [Frankia canadensis]SNQ46674.1 conserved hypothetical protein [Frankia canadensis]SOU53964.1 conserved hypothetical protein [Frankia canadensis]